jgi:hypothetical protein
MIQVYKFNSLTEAQDFLAEQRDLIANVGTMGIGVIQFDESDSTYCLPASEIYLTELIPVEVDADDLVAIPNNEIEINLNDL